MPARERAHQDRSRQDLEAVLDLLPFALVDSSQDLDTHLQILAERVRVTLAADSVMVFMAEPDDPNLTLQTHAVSDLGRALGLGEGMPTLVPVNLGVLGWVMQNGKSVLIGDMTTDPRAQIPNRGARSKSVVAAPLLVRGKPIGVLRVGAVTVNRFLPSDQRLVEALALAAGVAVENARLSHDARGHIEELEVRNREVAMLAEVGDLVLQSLDSQGVIELVMDKMLEVGFDLATMHLLRERVMAFVGSRGLRDPGHAESYVLDEQSERRQRMFHVLSRGETLVVPHVPSFDGLQFMKSEGVESAVVVPIHVDGMVIGVLSLGSRERRDHSTSTVHLLEGMAAQLGVAVQKALLNEGTRQALTEAKESADALATSLSLLEATLESTNEGILVVDGKGMVLRHNQRFLDLWSVPPELADDPRRGLLFTYVKEQMLDPEAFERRVDELIATNMGDETFDVLECKDGRVVERYSRPAHLPGRPTVRVWSFRDVTERRHIQDRLLRAERLETAGRIAGQVAHDFNNLLAPMVGYPDLIKDRLPPDHPAVAWCDLMAQAAEQAARINEDLMAFGRRAHVERVPCDINELVEQAIPQLGETEGLQIVREQDPGLLPVTGAPAQLLRLIVNLLANANDAMQGSGSLTIRTANVYLDQTIGEMTRVPVGEYVRLDIEDTGPGITVDVRDKIFDAFFTTKKTGRRRGAGLGLSVVHAVAEDHDAYVDVRSSPGHGSTFSVFVPASRNVVVERAMEVPAVGGSESILVIDDDPFQRAVGQELLSSLGYRVSTAASGEEAIATAAGEAFDLLVLDMVMPPGIDGAETFQRVRQRWPKQRAILLSGFAESERVRAAQQQGAGQFLRKPVARRRLAEAVRAELDHQ